LKNINNEQKKETKVKVKIGLDIKIIVDLNENEFRSGVDKRILIEKYVKCGICEGSGSLLKKES
jgi:DnaJ-class molecular chaperone